MFKIYMITCIINNKKYVGQTIKTLEQRFQRHTWACTSKNNCAISAAIKKYGKENFIIELIEVCETLDEANELEVYYCNIHNTMSPNGYNLKAGGRKYTSMSDETREKIRQSQIGRKATEETKRKLSESHKGYKVPEEQLKKRRELMKGKPLSNVAIENAIKANSKNYELENPDGEIILVNNMAKFCRENNLSKSDMCEVVKGKKKSYKGWTGKCQN